MIANTHTLSLLLLGAVTGQYTQLSSTLPGDTSFSGMQYACNHLGGESYGSSEQFCAVKDIDESNNSGLAVAAIVVAIVALIGVLVEGAVISMRRTVSNVDAQDPVVKQARMPILPTHNPTNTRNERCNQHNRINERA